MWLVVVAVSLLGCGRLGFEARDAASITADTAPPALGPFGAPVPIAELNTTNREDDPSLTADLLEIFFASDRPGGLGGVDLWTAVRSDPSSPWSAPQPLVSLNSAVSDSGPRISRDGLTLTFTSKRAPDSLGDPWVATRSTRQSAWNAPVRIVELASAGAEEGSIVFDGAMHVLVMHSDRDGSLGLYTSTRADTTQPWSMPAALTELNATGDDLTPWLALDGRVIYFASDRPGGAGSRDLYRASRATATAVFDDVVPVTELNTNVSDTDPWLSDDERLIVFSRGIAVSGTDLMEARR